MEPEPQSPAPDELVSHRRSSVAPPQSPQGVLDMFVAVPVLARMLWFFVGACVATAATVLVMQHSASAPAGNANTRPPPYEGLPFADNAGVCQEFVALAVLATSHADAQSTAERLATALPPSLRPDNLRVVRAFAPGDQWTIAVDTQAGTGDMEHARAVATTLNAVPGFGLKFEAVHYTARRLYESAHVLCMPRNTTEAP